MRMRKKKHGEERIAACASLLCDREQLPITSPAIVCGKEAPLCLEIGCGKGGFACAMAEKYPQRMFYAMEKIPNVMICALEKAMERKEERPSDNLRFMIANAQDLEAWFAPSSVDFLYLNFSDPWPKARHAERRLTYREFLKKYMTLLRPGGVLQFKTDNVALFDFSLEELASVGITPTVITRDLHSSPYALDNVMTEYEKNFSSRGYPIHMLRFSKDEQ